MALDNAKIKQLRTIGHKLKPVVTISENGLTEGVAAELERALDDHELIKVKFAFEDREAKKLAVGETVKTTKAELVNKLVRLR